MRGVSVFIAACLSASVLRAEGPDIGGHIKFLESYSSFRDSDFRSQDGKSKSWLESLEARLKVEKQAAPWEFSLHGESLSVWEESLLSQQGLGIGGDLDDDERFFDLARVVSDGANQYSVLRLDRAYVGYAHDALAVRLGRQALTWGNGLFFQVLDLFNPFSPVAIDKDYKTGNDMAYAAWNFEQAGQIEFLYVPHNYSEKSVALKYKGQLKEFEYDLLVAEHYDETVVGAGLSRNILDGVFRIDGSYTNLKGAENSWSYLANYDRTFTLLGKNLHAMLEFFHNGIGQSEPYDLTDQALTERLARGELFAIAKNYLAFGVQLELSGLSNLYLTHIYNVEDKSAYAQARYVWNIFENVYLHAGANLPYAAMNSEFGGVEVAPGRVVAPAVQGYLKVDFYF